MAFAGASRKRSGATPTPRPRQQRAPQRKPARSGAVRQVRADAGATRLQMVRASVAAIELPALRLPKMTISGGELVHRSLPLLALLLVAALGFAGWRLLAHVGSVPVSRVLFTGKLERVDRSDLVSRVEPLLVGEGFLTADIDRIRAALLELPWVAAVSVQRRWPDELVVDVREQQAIARWGGDGLLNRQGEVFRPESLAAGAGLPALSGPDKRAAEVIARYAELNRMLADRQLRVASLGTDQRGSWELELEGGVVLQLGTGDVLKKMRRFLGAYDYDLKQQLDRIDYVDLRYTNGLAVSWKPLPQHANNNAVRAAATGGVQGNG